jgi:tRNA G10  N-methylase Trm11
MKKYIFIFGRDPELSYAELISYLKNFNIKYKLENYEKNVAIFSLDKFNVDIFKLGGTVKIAEIILENEIKDMNFYLGTKNKINYAISAYGDKKLFEEFGEYMISWFKSQKIKAMRKRPGETDFTPKELKDVLEFIIFKGYIGRTILVSNPQEYKRRDNERLFNDFKRNMSIRLAKIMINLSGGRDGKKLLDPFCGLGVLLEECVLQGIECSGVEIDDKIRFNALKNLKNLHKGTTFKILKGDSSRVDRYFNKNTFDCIASEPYLGPYFKSYPKKEEVVKVVKELNVLYEKFFINLKKVLKKNGRVAIEMPVLKASNRKKYKLNVDSFLKKSGFKIVKLDDVIFPILYKEKKSIIEREIYVLE